MLRMHEGFNLYNIGLTCGFFGLFAASLLTALNRDLTISIIWNEEPSLLLTLLVPGLSLLIAGWGIAMDGLTGTLKGLKKIHRLSGRLPSDFMELVSPGASLVNAGLSGPCRFGVHLCSRSGFQRPCHRRPSDHHRIRHLRQAPEEFSSGYAGSRGGNPDFR